MLYLGRVIDNRYFGTNGTIEVLLISNYEYLGPHTYSKGLEEIPNDIQYMLPSEANRADKATVSCYIVSPMGNAYNTGSFQLPQINTIGVIYRETEVKWEGGDSEHYFWLGGIYGCKKFGVPVIIPGDDTVSEDLSYEDLPMVTNDTGEDFYKDGQTDSISNSKELFDKSQLIIKTKSSRLTSKEDPDTAFLDFKQIPSENTVVLNKDKIAIRHNTYEEYQKNKIADIIQDDNQIKIKRIVGNDGTKEAEQLVILDDNQITISYNNEKDGKSNKIIMKSDGSIEISGSSDVKVSTEGNMSFAANKNVEITSKGMTSIKANNVNLADIMVGFFKAIETLKTTGSPFTHFTDPTSIEKIVKLHLKYMQGYN